MPGKAAACVIVSGGSTVDLYECVLSLAESTYAVSSTMVVDNSPDGLNGKFAQAFPRAKVVRPPSLLTFAQAANLGMKTALSAGAGLVFLLNDDVTVHPKALSILAEAESNLGPGIFAPEIWPYEGRAQRTRLALDWDKRLAVKRPVAINGPLTPLDYAEASAVLVSAEVFSQIGFLDEDFAFYYEDVDFSVRAADGGFPVLEVEGARVWHKGSVSAGKGLSPFKAYYRARNTLKFARKHRDRAHLLSNAAYHFGSFVIPAALKAASGALVGRRKDAKVLSALVKGTWDCLTGNGHTRPAQTAPTAADELDRIPLLQQA